jgi:flagellar hook-associated protein 2
MSNPTIDGLVSGLSTGALIDQLMAVEKQPLTTLKNQQNQAALKQQAVDSLKSQITSLQTAIKTLTNRGTLNGRTVNTDTPSSSPVVLTATATSSAATGVFKVTVNQLATASKVQSGGAIGNVVNKDNALVSGGFRLAPVTTVDGAPASFTINGKQIQVDADTTLDGGTANSLIAKINAAGAGVTASLVADASGRAGNAIQLVAGPGQTVQVGAIGDTSNVLSVLNLTDATVQGNSSANVTSGAAAAGALSTSITINGIQTTIEQSNAAFSATENATFIANAINANTANKVQAVDNGDGSFRLEQKTLGSQAAVNITAAGSGTGLTVGQTQNGTDKLVSTAALGAVDTEASLGDARLNTAISGLDESGGGKFTINGVEIAYKSTESIGAVLSRINNSTAGVTAAYDSIQDRISLTANQTGARSISMTDTTGNFLAATGLIGATQTIGVNASLSIDTINGGRAVSSSSNTITSLLPGVTLNLRSTSTTPVTLTIGQNTSNVTTALHTFVDKFNSVLSTIDSQTAYDPDTRQQSLLTGDTAVLGIQRQLRSLVTNPAPGSSSLHDLSSIGLSFGAIGSAVGTTQKLQLDDTKLSEALNDSPQAVMALLNGFDTSLGAPSGSGNIVAVSGTPTDQLVDGTYTMKVLDGSNNVEVLFHSNSGGQDIKRTGTLTPGSENTSLIPGLKIKANTTLTPGQDTVALSVNTRGVGVQLQSYLNGLLGTNGLFQARTDAAQAAQEEYTRRIADTQTRIDAKQAELNRKFSGLEVTLSKLQTQGNALSAQIAKLSG